MNVEVSLARHAAPWRFRGSGSAEKWVTRRPWTETGGVRTLLVDVRGSVEGVIQAVRSAIVAADAGRSQVRVFEPPALSAEGNLQALLSTEFELPGAGGDERAWRQMLSEYLRATPPAVVVLEVQGPDVLAKVRNEATRLCDAIAKATPPAALTVVLVAPSEGPGAADADDFAQGAPVEAVVGAHSEAVALLWPRYAHARIAWESGGRRGWAEAINTAGVEAVAPGNDAALEAALNVAAQALWAEIPEPSRALFLAWLGEGTSTKDTARTVELLRLGLAWTPGAGAHPQPAPWAARAVLQVERRPATQRTLLRGGLVCQPLALELLGRCFALELRLRARAGVAAKRSPSDEATGYFRDFLGVRNHFTRGLYPQGTPALPEDAWGFASLGELLAALGVPNTSEVKDLGNLRNALAHGHYAGWAAIDCLRRVEARLERT